MAEIVHCKGHEIEFRESPNPARPDWSIWRWSVFADQNSDEGSGDDIRQLLGSSEQAFGTRGRAMLDAMSFIDKSMPSEFTPVSLPSCERCGQDSTDGAEYYGGGRLCERCLLEVEWIRIYLMIVPNETWCPHCHRVLTRYEKRGAVWGWFPRACLGRLGCVELRDKTRNEDRGLVGDTPERAHGSL